MLVSVSDNYASFPGEAVPQKLWPGAEITVWGVVQGIENMLKRACVHMISGPISINFDFDDGWDTVVVRARNMCGGSTLNLDGSPPQPTQENKYRLQVQLFIKPRSGFAAPETGGARKAG